LFSILLLQHNTAEAVTAVFLQSNAVADVVSLAMAAETDTNFVITSSCFAKGLLKQVAAVTAHAVGTAGLPKLPPQFLSLPCTVNDAATVVTDAPACCYPPG